ncbi:Metallo-hydrolase/oxidoreductase [Mycena vulgaris]|nr:Metallo-hydrolase/oxidoreductase [Mycena vulgaris]
MHLKLSLSLLVSPARCVLCPRMSVRAFHQATHLPFGPKIRVLSTRQYASVPARFQYHASQSPNSPAVYSFFEKHTKTWQYVVLDPVTKDTALIDTVLNYEPSSGTVSSTAADELLTFIKEHNLNIKYILETHAHTDHLSAAQFFRGKFDAPIKVGIGARISQVQKTFAPVYGFEPSAFVDVFDLLFQDDEEFSLGDLRCRVIYLPGHTPDHVGYVIGQSVFTGDSIFQPDVGSARTDFPGGDAKALYSSMRRLMALPESFRLFVGHDYPVDRGELCASTVGQQLKSNKHSRTGITESDFIAFRNAIDRVLGAPHLLHPSLQTNIRGGKLPPRDANGRRWFRIPSIAL